MNNQFLTSIIIAAATFYLVWSLASDDDDEDFRTTKRLNDIKNKVFGVNQKKERENKLNQNIKSLILDTEYKVKLLGTILDKVALTETLKKQLKIANIKTTVDIFLIICVILAAPFLLMILIIPEKAIMLLPIGLIMGYLPFFEVKRRIKKRHEQFSQQFPDGLGLISSSLRAGHSLPASFHMVVTEMPEPISHVFKIVVDDISLGRDTRDALENMANFLPDSIDLRFFITAVLIQREIGGNLAEILDNLSFTIRERFKLIGQLNSQTAQAKLSGIVLALAPAVIGMIIYVLNPGYLDPLFKQQMGQLALLGAITMAGTGFMIINKITNIRI